MLAVESSNTKSLRVAMSMVLVLAVLLAITTTLQTIELQRLRPAVRLWRQRAQWPVVGGTLPVFTGQRLDGSVVELTPTGDARQLWFIFTTSCPNCRATMAQWKRLAASALSQSATPAYWVSLSPVDSTLRHATEFGLPMDRVVLLKDHRAIRAARMPGVPLTIAVSAEGRVEGVHAGLLADGPVTDSLLLAARRPRVKEEVRTAPTRPPRQTP